MTKDLLKSESNSLAKLSVTQTVDKAPRTIFPILLLNLLPPVLPGWTVTLVQFFSCSKFPNVSPKSKPGPDVQTL